MNYYGKFKGIELYHISPMDYINEVLLKNDTTNRMYILEGVVLYKGKIYGTLDEDTRQLTPKNASVSQYEIVGPMLVEALRAERKKASDAKSQSMGSQKRNKKNNNAATSVANKQNTSLAEKMLEEADVTKVEDLVDMMEAALEPTVELEWLTPNAATEAE